ncbi:hypothetical protein WN943_009730 [Citrus x changshan-huyou]
MSIPPTNVAVDKEGSPVVANKSREKFGPWMVVTRKGRAKVVVDRENISDLERNQQNNFSTASHFAALADDPYTNAAVEVVVQNPIFVPPQRPTTSITDHFNIRKNFTLKTSTTLKLHNHLAKGCSSEKDSANSEQQRYPQKLANTPNEKDEREVNIMANYAGDPQLASNQVSEDIMSDDENAVVNETPGMHEGAALGVNM